MKPSAPPQPPRRHSSGIRNERADENQPPTQNYGEPPTMAAARARIHEIARELPAENRFGGAPARFDDETQGRIDGADLAAAHAAYDRQQYGAPPQAYPEPQHYEQQGYSNGVDSYGQPQQAHQEHYDAEYQHQDPMTELRPAYDEALNRHEDQYGRAGSDRPLSDRPLPEDDSSGEYQRRQHEQGGAYNSNSYDAAAYEANYPKPARREEPSYVERAPTSDRPSDRSGERGSERGNSFRNDDFPRDKSSYRDSPEREGRERGSIRRDDAGRDEKSSYRGEPERERGNSFSRRDEERGSERGNSHSRRDREEARDDRKGNSYQPPRGEQQADHTRAEGSGAKHASDRGSSYSKNEPSIPGPARVPAELRVPDNFVVGVQPIRTPSMGASAFPQPQAVIAPAYGAPPATMAASPGALGGSMPPGMPQITMPPLMASNMPQHMPGMQMQPMGPMTGPMGGMGAMGGMGGMSAMNQGMHVRAHTSMRPGGHVAQPTEVEEAAQGSKVGRFAWFVFGAAFGIFFAFAATGFGFGKKDDAQGNFPPPAQLPAPVQAQQVQPPPAAAPPPVVMQQPVIQQPQAQMMAPQVQMQQPVPQVQMQQQLAPAVAPQGQMGAPPPGVITNGQQVAPIVPAPQGPRGQQQQQVAQNQGSVRVRNPAPPPVRRSGGRPAPRGDDDDAPPPRDTKKSAGKDDASDILGAAL